MQVFLYLCCAESETKPIVGGCCNTLPRLLLLGRLKAFGCAKATICRSFLNINYIYACNQNEIKHSYTVYTWIIIIIIIPLRARGHASCISLFVVTNICRLLLLWQCWGTKAM